MEVKFSNEKLVFDAVYYAVRTALDSSIQRPTLYNEPNASSKGKELISTPFPVTDRSEKTPKAEKIVFDTNSNFGVLRQDNTINYSDMQLPKKEAPVSSPSKDYADEEAFSLSFPKKQDVKAEPIRPIQQAQEIYTENSKITGDVSDFGKKADEISDTPNNEKVVPEYKIIGEAFNSYVIVEMGDIMYLIDKHAAHERIIFEDLKKKLSLSTPSSQMLMLPIVTHLNNEELVALHQYGDEIKKMGFSYDIDDKSVYLNEIPSEIEISGAQDAFSTLVSRLVSKEGYGELTRYEFFEKALYQASCKAAIKAGRIYDSAHIKWICDKVLTLDNIKYCPHGRPIAFEITKHFLEKQFERIK